VHGLGRVEEVSQHPREALWILEVGEVGGPREDLEAAARNRRSRMLAAWAPRE